MRSVSLRVVWLVAIAALLAALPTTAAHAVTRSQADAAVLRALKVTKGDGPLVVFRDGRTVAPATRVTQAGRVPGVRAARSGARDRVLRAAGVEVVSAPLVLRTARGERSWVYYEDQAPFQASEHAGRVVSVGQRTGRVQVSRTLRWPPLIGGDLPVYLETFEGYRDERYRVFTRAWKLASGAKARRSRNTLDSQLPVTLDRDETARAATRAAAAALAAERACTIRFSDTLGDFFDAGAVDRTRAALGLLLAELAPASGGVVDRRYRLRAPRAGSPADFVRSVIEDEGCRNVVLYIAGAGTTTRAGAPAVAVGVKSRRGHKLETQLISAAGLRAIVDDSPAVGFTLEVDAPGSGAFLAAVGDRPNLQAKLASSTGDGPGFAAISDVVDADGNELANSGNPRGYLEFTNRQLRGLGCFLSRPQEVAAAQRAVASGRAPSLLSWMFTRAIDLCVQSYLPELVEGGSSPQITTVFPRPSDADINRPPVAADVRLTTDEDTPLALTLPGGDPDGDPLSYVISGGPVAGTLSGSGAARVYTPAADASGNDGFTVTVSDGSLSAAPVRVTIEVRPINDAPRFNPAPAAPTFTEAGPAVAVDPALELTDVDAAALTGASVAIDTGRQAGDVLSFTALHGISGSYDGATGVLTLSGGATPAQYQDVLRTVAFSNPGAALSNLTRQLVFRASDGETVGASAPRAVTVNVVNDAPTLQGAGGSAAFVEDDATGVAVVPSLDVGDVDSTFLAGATVTISAGLDPAEDELLLAPQPGITAAYTAATGTLALSGAATVSEYQAALRAVRYRNTDTAQPGTADRTISVQVDDGSAASNLSNTVTSTVTVTAVNDAPVLVAGAGAVLYTEGDAPAAVASALTAADADSTQLTEASVAISAGGAAGDELALPVTPGLSSSWDAPTRTLTITGAATVAAYQAALRSVTFVNTAGDDPQAGDRTISFTADDGEAANATSTAVTRTVTVSAVNDAPTLSSGGNTVSYTEDDATGVIVNGALTVVDPDSPTLSGATVQITTGLDSDDDQLVFVDQAGITGSYSAATGTLTLSGTATLSAYQAALRSIRYRNSDGGQPSTTTRIVTFTVSDGAATSNTSNSIVTNVEVTPVDDAPTVTLGGGAAPTFTEGGSPVVLDGGLTVTDPDTAQVTGAVVQISAGLSPGEDELLFTDAGAISGSYTPATGTLALTGNATPADYQAALRSITYRNTNADDPNTAARTVAFTVTAGGVPSATVSRSLSVVAVNDAPVLTASAGDAAYSEGGPDVAVDSAITLVDVDDATLTGAVISISTGYQPGDELRFTDTAQISGAWNAASRTLTLTGADSIAAYQSALRAVQFRHTTDVPSATTRTIAFALTDAAGAPAAASRGVAVTPTNDPPVVTAGGGSPSFTEGGAPVTVDPSLTVSDPEDNAIVGATVTVAAGGVSAEDRLAFTAQHGITGSYDEPTRTLTLSGMATEEQYTDALRSVTYENISTSPSVASRTIEFRASDGDVGPAATKAVAVISNNTAPSLGGGGNTLAYTEDDPATVINTAITASDGDDANLESARVEITAGGDTSEDVLEFTDTAQITGGFNAATGTLTLTGTATVAQYEAALRTVAYRNADLLAPSAADRTVSFTVNDGEAESAPATSTVTIAQAPDAPSISTTGGSAGFTEGGSPAVVDAGLTVSDPDSTQLAGATATISSGFSQAQGDTLAATGQAGISVSYAAATGVLTLTGTAALADYQAVLRTVTFSNTSDAPTSQRTISFQATDTTAAASSAATRDVTITGVNDAPTVSGGGTLAYTENDPATAISPGLALGDVDSAQISGATVSFGGGYTASEDVIAFVDQAGITGSFASGTLTLSGTASVAAYQTALRSITYRNTSEDPSMTQRSVTFTVTDAGLPLESGTTNAAIDVTAVNDAPLAVTDSSSTVHNTRLHYGVALPAGRAGRVHASQSVLTNDTDVDGPGPLSIDVASSPTSTALGGSVSWNADGTFTYDPPAGSLASSDTLSYRVTDGEAPPATGTVNVTLSGRVWYVDNQVVAGGDGRSHVPFDTLAEADAAATQPGDRIFVHRGDGTTSGLTGGVTLASSQQLLGETVDLTVSGHPLYDGQPSLRPAIGGTVNLAGSGNVVQGLDITAGSGAHAVSGGSGDSAGTLTDLQLTASGAGGRGLSLDQTTGSWSVSDLSVTTTGGAAGVTLANAGSVDFSSASNVEINAAGPGLTASGSTVTGQVDRTTVSGGATGIAMTSTTGTLTLDDIALTTTGTALELDSASGVTVRTLGGARGTISAGGTAVDLNTDAGTASTPPVVGLSTVSSTGGAYGIRLDDLGAGTFSATGGTLSGHSTQALSVSGGSGAITYPGAINNGTGGSVEITGRTGGAISLAGSIADDSDAGGGITISGNSGGSTSFTGSSVALNTGASGAVAISSTGPHAVSFTGGGLQLQTTSGTALRSVTSSGADGTLQVSGSTNTIATTSGGRGIEVDGTDLTGAGLALRSVSTSTAPTGILLRNTGTTAGLTIAGTGAANSGGTIAASTGPGVHLDNTAAISLSDVRVQNGGDDGIRGATVRGLTLDTVAVTGNGNAVTEHGIDLTELSGTSTITGATLTGNAEDNLAIANDAATISGLTMTGGTVGNNSSTIGNDGVRIENNGAGGTTATIQDVLFTENRGDHIQVVTDNSTTTTQNVTIHSNDLRGSGNQGGTTMLGGGIAVAAGGSAQQTVAVTSNDIERPRGSAISVNTTGGSAPTTRWTLTGNVIGTAGEAGSGSATNSGLYWNVNGNGTVFAHVANNQFRNTAFSSLDLVSNDGDPTVHATIENNTVAEPGPALTYTHGMRIVVGSLETDNGDACLNIQNNSLAGTGQGGLADLRLRVAGEGNTVTLPGYGGAAESGANVNTYLSGRNTVTTVNSTLFTGVGSSFVGGPVCTLP